MIFTIKKNIYDRMWEQCLFDQEQKTKNVLRNTVMPYYLVLAFLFFVVPAQSSAEEEKLNCFYLDEKGVFKQASSQNEIPHKYRSKASCQAVRKRGPARDLYSNRPSKSTKSNKAKPASSTRGGYLAQPDEIDLKGNIRREDISTSLGRVKLRWPRSVEAMFGRTPLRAVTDAARTVSRATRTAAFPAHIQNLQLEWKIVFMDENLPETQIPHYLIQNCHPGWMTPPANIYIVAQRIAENCGTTRKRASVADSDLTEVLIHEMGHVLEFNLLGNSFGSDRFRAEGFATWFEVHAAKYSSIVNESKLKRRTKLNAQFFYKTYGDNLTQETFRGGAPSYARAAMYFWTIADQKGLRTLFELYGLMAQGKNLFTATEDRLGWNKRKLEAEVKKFTMK